jgi:DNA modification methylase
MFSWDTSVVYDPFMGSGTTALACLQTRREYIGSEISEAYITLANNRIRAQTGDEEE